MKRLLTDYIPAMTAAVIIHACIAVSAGLLFEQKGVVMPATTAPYRKPLYMRFASIEEEKSVGEKKVEPVDNKQVVRKEEKAGADSGILFENTEVSSYDLQTLEDDVRQLTDPERKGEKTAVFSPPVLISEIVPVYPRSAKHRGLEGVVYIRIWIDKKGEVEKAVVEVSSGYEVLDRHAIAEVKRARFKPATVNNVPIDGQLTITVRYILTGG
jgi:protein TonB